MQKGFVGSISDFIHFLLKKKMFVTSLPLLSFLRQKITKSCLLAWLYWCTSKPLSEQMSSHPLFSGATVKPKADGYLGNNMHSGSVRLCSWNGNVSGKVLSCGLIHNYILWPSQTIPREAYPSAFQHCCFWPAWAVHRSHRARKGNRMGVVRILLIPQ